MSAAAQTELPERDAAMRVLCRRQMRAVGLLLLRIVLLAMLSATLKIQMPWLRGAQGLLDAGMGILALWPFWTSVGRNWQWRIHLGKAYANAGRHDDAVAVLQALDGIQGRLFDAQGEGAAILSRSREAAA